MHIKNNTSLSDSNWYTYSTQNYTNLLNFGIIYMYSGENTFSIRLIFWGVLAIIKYGKMCTCVWICVCCSYTILPTALKHLDIVPDVNIQSGAKK